MKNKKLFFYITKDTYGKYRIESADVCYHWREGLLKDNIKPENLGLILEKITEILHSKYNIDTLFEFRNI